MWIIIEGTLHYSAEEPRTLPSDFGVHFWCLKISREWIGGASCRLSR